ncbi:MFS general substrate transporter [Lophium mytilinum]|uniref:MFS general substrate transporter n=1 Tax=Lophium mytilinum TaxID=390894 RepID=A0A6A6R8J3_9PEZI|nr:MFS general substrate transporter [Lophium mytilinum]
MEVNWPRSWRAYFCWLGCFFLMFNSWGLVNAYGTFASYYMGHTLKGQAGGQLSLNLIGSTQSFLVLLFSGPVGRLLDAGHFRVVIGTGAFLVPFGLMMLSIAVPSGAGAKGNYAFIWLTQGLTTGLGMACYFVTSSQVAATWFPRRKGLAVGFVACGASVAGVIYPVMIRYITALIGFNNAVRCVAAVAAGTGFFSFVFATPDPHHEHPQPQSYRKLKTWIDTAAFKNTAFCWYMVSISFLFFGFYPVFFNLEEWAATRNFGYRDGLGAAENQGPPRPSGREDPIQTFWLLSIMNGSSTCGRLIMAFLSDSFGPLNMHIATTLISALLILLFWTFAASTTHAIAFCVLFGAFSGAVIGLPPAGVANILANNFARIALSRTVSTSRAPSLHLNHAATAADDDTLAALPTTLPPATLQNLRQVAMADDLGPSFDPHTRLGQWVGMMYSGAAVPALAGPVIAGALIQHYRDYITVQMWSGACLVLSAACMGVARYHLPSRGGLRWNERTMSFLPWRAQSEREHAEERKDRNRSSPVPQHPKGAIFAHSIAQFREARLLDVVIVAIQDGGSYIDTGDGAL